MRFQYASKWYIHRLNLHFFYWPSDTNKWKQDSFTLNRKPLNQNSSAFEHLHGHLTPFQSQSRQRQDFTRIAFSMQNKCHIDRWLLIVIKPSSPSKYTAQPPFRGVNHHLLFLLGWVRAKRLQLADASPSLVLLTVILQMLLLTAQQ